MNGKLKLLDLFCGAGGAGYGYFQAGFEVVGVDIKPQKRYPFEFIQANALEFLGKYGHEFDVVHTSPPCQVYSVTASLSTRDHPDLVGPTREALKATGKPYIIENVPGAPLINPLMLCGTMFGLRVIRHRLFETVPAIWFSPAACCHWGKATGCESVKGQGTNSLKDYAFVTVVGNDYLANEGRMAMGIDWMVKRELSQAIPPAYTKWLGEQIKLKMGVAL